MTVKRNVLDALWLAHPAIHNKACDRLKLMRLSALPTSLVGFSWGERDSSSGLEVGVRPSGNIIPEVKRDVGVRASIVIRRAGSAVAETVGRPFHYQKLLIEGRCAFIDEFTVTNEVMPLHSHHKGWHMNLRGCARCGVVGAAPIHLALVQRVLGLDGVGAQE